MMPAQRIVAARQIVGRCRVPRWSERGGRTVLACGRCEGCREIDRFFWVDRARQIRRHVATDSWESLLRAVRFVDEVLFKLVQP